MSVTKAQEILNKYWDKTIPIDPVKLAQAAGAVVVPSPDLQTSGQFSCEVNQPIIRYKSTESEVRQRFTIAHELGHFVLGHGGAYRDDPSNFSLANHDPLEVAANRFAAELLMPEEVLQFLIVEQGTSDIASLAKQLRVSQVAMKYRLKNLGWIN